MQLRLDRGDDSTGVIRTAPAPVAQLILVDLVEAGDWAVELPRPVLLYPRHGLVDDVLASAAEDGAAVEADDLAGQVAGIR